MCLVQAWGYGNYKTLFSEGNQSGAGKVVIGTVEGDLHDIGKNLAAMMLQGAGFKVIYLDTNIKPKDFVDAVKKYNPDIVRLHFNNYHVENGRNHRSA